MLNQIAIFWIVSILLFGPVNMVMAQSGERLSCGQSFALEKLSRTSTLHTQGEIQAKLRAQLTVPVIVHVVWQNAAENISDALILSQLEVLNRDFNAQNEDLNQVPDEFQDRIGNVGISFCLASRTPEGNPTNGIVRVKTNIREIGISDSLYADSTNGSTAWDTEQYLNIWVANTGSFISGYGAVPGLTAPYQTGVVIHPKYFGLNGHPKYGLGRTLVHEIGHYFGLKHIWSGDPNCEEDDGIADTPTQLHEHIGCPGYPQASCTSSDMYMNFMDYADDPCMLLFTQGQKERIWESIATFRPGLLNNAVAYYCLHSERKTAVEFKLTPNPTPGPVSIALEEEMDGLAEIQIFDMLGKLHMHFFALVRQEYTLDTANLEPGMYFIRINDRSQRLIKM